MKFFWEAHFESQDFSPSSVIRCNGFIARKVEQAAKETGYDFDEVHVPANENENYGLACSQFVVPLVKGMQEQQQIMAQQRKAIEELKRQNDLMQQELEALILAKSKK